MKQVASLIAVSLFGISYAAAEEHAARGLVLQVDSAHHRFVASCDPIPGYMDAMEMLFTIRDPKSLSNLKPGAIVRFTIVESGKTPYAQNIQAIDNFEPEPAGAGTLTALSAAVDPATASKAVQIGQPVPDFSLTDQAGRPVTLSQCRGKVIALTFGYSRCPNPNYCLRLSRNLSQVQSRFREHAGRDLILMTIAIDPEYDHGAALARYAASFGANAGSWHFLTGSVGQVHEVAGLFGMNFWTSEGLLTHTLHTVIIDRNGRLAANIDGNQFSSRQLGDLILAVMNRR
jgi:protein SCO1/2